MTYIAISDIRTRLGAAYTSTPDDATITFFIDQREAELDEELGTFDTLPASLKQALICTVAADVLENDLTGVVSAQSNNYKLGDLSENYSPNIELKTEQIASLRSEAEKAKMRYLELTSYQGVMP